ncbi:hypothetical protein [Acinetobacter sp. CE-15]|uniref:hypothetical protein n=1 Tax=Acinetobacter sp. CE-15 TaxID=3425693 RepID=UPI003DA6B164
MLRIVFGFFVIYLLTACNTLSLLRDSTIADSFIVGSNKSTILKQFGKPLSTIPTLNGSGVCYNYKHTLPNGTETPLYVGFRNSDDKVVAYGTVTCETAKKNGFLNKNTPIEQKF